MFDFIVFVFITARKTAGFVLTSHLGIAELSASHSV